MVVAATMAFREIFCLTPAYATAKEHAEVLSKFGIVVVPRVAAFAGAFITADLAKDSLMVVPVAGWILNVLLGGAISGVAMSCLCEDLIPRLHKMAAAFYEMDLQGDFSQSALDRFQALGDELFPINPVG